MGLAPGLLPPAPSPYSHPSLYTADPLHAELLAREAQRAAELQKGLDMHRWGRLPQFPGGSDRVVLQTGRVPAAGVAAAGRGAGHLLPQLLLQRWEKLKCQAPCRPLLLCYVYVPLCIIYCDDYTAIRVLVHCIERAGDMQLHSSLAADGQYFSLCRHCQCGRAPRTVPGCNGKYRMESATRDHFSYPHSFISWHITIRIFHIQRLSDNLSSNDMNIRTRVRLATGAGNKP